MLEPPIILASQSPRRVSLLRAAGIAFTPIAPPYIEPAPDGWPHSPAAFAERLSAGKAGSLARTCSDRIILGADTVVAVAGQIIGKADHADHARQILRTLFNTRHEVITGVTLLHTAAGRSLTRHAVTLCQMRAMSEPELEEYIASQNWQGKAGAYGIQDRGDKFVRIVQGDFDNVVGLPVRLVREMLSEIRA